MIKKKFESKDLLENELLESIAALINKKKEIGEEATILFSGGSTPAGLFSKLSELKLDWSKVKIGLVDDRMVPNESEYSNAKMINDLLLSKIKSKHKPMFYPLVFDFENEKKNTRELNNIKEEIGIPDIVILGMGNDGHFASLFPKDKNSERGLFVDNKNVFCYTNAPNHPKKRISFTWSFLRKSASIYLFITGEEKLSLIEDKNNRNKLPIDAVLSEEETESTMYWAP